MTRTAPVRVQRRRSRGCRMPAGAVYVGRPSRWGNPWPVTEHGAVGAVDRYRAWLLADADRVAAVRAELPGRDLACWCRPDAPCHADVLLDVANRDNLGAEPRGDATTTDRDPVASRHHIDRTRRP